MYIHVCVTQQKKSERDNETEPPLHNVPSCGVPASFSPLPLHSPEKQFIILMFQSRSDDFAAQRQDALQFR